MRSALELALPSRESILTVLYAAGILGWLLVWWIGDGYRLMVGEIRLLWIPFGVCIGVLFGNALLWHAKASIATLELEESLFNFLDTRSANIINATGSVLVIATIIYGVNRTQIPKDFLRFEALAFICLLGFSAPILWIPTYNPYWLMLLRHYQTIPFTYGIYLGVSGILVLLYGLGIEIPSHEQEADASPPVKPV